MRKISKVLKCSHEVNKFGMNSNYKSCYKNRRKIMENILNIQNVEKYYGNKDNVTKALDNISFRVEKGEFVGIMGLQAVGRPLF